MYIELENVEELPPGRVTANFAEQSMMIKVRGLRNGKYPDGVNLRLWCEELWGPIDRGQCTMNVKKVVTAVAKLKELITSCVAG